MRHFWTGFVWLNMTAMAVAVLWIVGSLIYYMPWPARLFVVGFIAWTALLCVAFAKMEERKMQRILAHKDEE